jgi:hypothetical protein
MNQRIKDVITKKKNLNNLYPEEKEAATIYSLGIIFLEMFHLAFFTDDEIQDKQNFMKKKLNWGCSNKDVKAILKGCI